MSALEALPEDIKWLLGAHAPINSGGDLELPPIATFDSEPKAGIGSFHHIDTGEIVIDTEGKSPDQVTDRDQRQPSHGYERTAEPNDEALHIMGVTPASQRSELDATQPITRKYVVLSEDDRIAIRRHHALNPKARKIQTARKYNVYRETIASILKN
ncbi:hypothetical protein FRB95_013338 [Tulasnella sp. JGI-2019a]|nr:hypothetical protein FRB95_013338 [Tulasnella sp. JGI-2019a]